jgi:hypothetical protein
MTRKSLKITINRAKSTQIARRNERTRVRKQSRALSAREAKRILESTQHSLDRVLSQRILCEAFDLADGGVLLLFENGRGRLYESRVELQTALEGEEEKARRGP